MKVTLITIILVITAVSVSEGGYRRGRKLVRDRQRGRDLAAAEAAADPETAANHDIIDDALDAASETNDVVEIPEDLSPSDALQAGEALQSFLTDAILVAKEQPQAGILQDEIVAEQIADAHDTLSQHLTNAQKIQRGLTKHGADMTPEEAAEAHQALHHELELALHFAIQHDAAVQQDKAIEDGSPQTEVVQVAEEVKLQGRAAKVFASANPAVGR